MTEEKEGNLLKNWQRNNKEKNMKMRSIFKMMSASSKQKKK